MVEHRNDIAGLTERQVKRLEKLLAMAMQAGHGEVTIRISRGLPRFVSVKLEEAFEPGGEPVS